MEFAQIHQSEETKSVGEIRRQPRRRGLMDERMVRRRK